jgi:VWFA-related protein
MSPSRSILVLLVLLIAVPGPAQEPPRAGEVIVVERLIVDAHITWPDGEPIPNLTAGDLEVTIDGQPAEIDGVDWFPEEGTFVDPETGARMTPLSDSSRGRLLVFFFQTDFQRARVKGQMRMVDHAQEFLSTLTSDDLVAVVQFDSKLKVLEDFTNDHERLKEVIERSLRIDDYFWRYDGRWPSISRYLTVEMGEKAATPERALRYVGEALQRMDGVKSIVMFGWGLGEYAGQGRMSYREFEPTQLALETARASIFSLDVSDADWHTLELGLRKMSEETGGFYEKTHLFPTLAMDRLRKTLSGRYEIVLFKPDNLKPGPHHEVDIKVNIKGDVRVLTRGTWIER